MTHLSIRVIVAAGVAGVSLAVPALAQLSVAAAPVPVVAPAPVFVTVIAGPRFDVGPLSRLILGSVHRDLWTTAIQVPVLDIQTFAGGIKALKAGGGKQTRSLRMVTKGGNEYAFRSVVKDHAWTVPPSLEHTPIAGLSRDQRSANHPGAALMASRLLEAAGVLHPTPILVWMPKDADLGEFTKDFAGQLGWIEPFPHKPDSGDGFAGKAAIVDTEDLLKKLNSDPGELVDAPAFLTARLVDMVTGNWDRHEGQWKWAKIKSGGDTRWVAIPRDQDMAFVTYEGLIGKVGSMVYPFHRRFRGGGVHERAVSWNSLELDRRLLGSLDRRSWDSVVTEFGRRVNEAVVDSTVATLPREYRPVEPRMAAMLKERLRRLPALTDQMYREFALVADIHGTDAFDRASVRHVAGGFVDVRLESADGTPSFVRRFDSRETREIRIYLHGGADSATVTGDASRRIAVRVVGGNGKNWFADSSTENGRRGSAHLYDRGDVRGVSYGKDTLFDRRHWEDVAGKTAPPPRDRGDSLKFGFAISAERGLGFTPRISLTSTKYGFETRPYSSQVSLSGAFSTTAHGFRVIATGDKRLEGSAVHFTGMARLSWLEMTRYHGLGNASPDSGKDSEYFAVRQRVISARPAIAVSLGARGDLSVGPIVQYSTTSSTAGRFFALDKPYGSGPFGQAGVQVALHHDLTSRDSIKSHRLILNATAAAYPAVWDVKSAFQSAMLGLEGQVMIPVPTRPTFSFRTGGKRVFGEFPFHEAASIGANHTARYVDPQRYAGDASLFGSAELRVPVGILSAILPFDAGLVGVADAGRVYLRGESPGGWHTVVGGGLWFGLSGNHMKVITLTMVTERGRTGLALRTGLGF